MWHKRSSFVCCKGKITLLKPKYIFNLGEYEVEGDIFGWNFKVLKEGQIIATIQEEIFHIRDTYVISVNDEDALNVLMVVLAIDASKCTRDTVIAFD